MYGNGNSTEFKVYNTYRPASETKVTTLPITVTGYKADAKIADAAVTTTEPGIKLSYIQFMEKDSAGDWTSAPLTGTFKADTEYRVEVYFNKLRGCDYTGLKKENVTVNGVELTSKTKNFVESITGSDQIVQEDSLTLSASVYTGFVT